MPTLRRLAVIALAGLFLSPYPASAGPAPQIDSASFDQFAADLLTPQADYAAANGRYFQIIITHDSPPSDLATAPPDEARRPTDGGPSLADLGLQAASDIALQVDEYSGPYGIGFVVYGSTERGGVVYQRGYHFGADPAFTSYDWRPVPQESIE